MREVTTKNSVLHFLERLGQLATEPADVYLTGGACAVLYAWRPTTIDVDLTIYPESDALLTLIPALKEELNINIELVSPSDFIPELPGWRERSIFIDKYGAVSAFHYDFYSQALSKIERGHRKDMEDVIAMCKSKLIKASELMAHFDRISAQLYRYPAIDPASFRKSVAEFAKQQY